MKVVVGLGINFTFSNPWMKKIVVIRAVGQLYRLELWYHYFANRYYLHIGDNRANAIEVLAIVKDSGNRDIRSLRV